VEGLTGVSLLGQFWQGTDVSIAAHYGNIVCVSLSSLLPLSSLLSPYPPLSSLSSLRSPLLPYYVCSLMKGRMFANMTNVPPALSSAITTYAILMKPTTGSSEKYSILLSYNYYNYFIL
jgi:hypothetical protein